MREIKKHVKSQKGFTLIELLAVVVILGIIAAIAIPAIGNIMKNSEKDAHVVNAKQMASSARMYFTENGSPATGTSVTLQELQNGGYIENISDPSVKGTTYDLTASLVKYTPPTEASGTGSSATTASGAKYEVTLKGSGSNAVTYMTLKESSTVKRGDVTLKTAN